MTDQEEKAIRNRIPLRLSDAADVTVALEHLDWLRAEVERLNGAEGLMDDDALMPPGKRIDLLRAEIKRLKGAEALLVDRHEADHKEVVRLNQEIERPKTLVSDDVLALREALRKSDEHIERLRGFLEASERLAGVQFRRARTFKAEVEGLMNLRTKLLKDWSEAASRAAAAELQNEALKKALERYANIGERGVFEIVCDALREPVNRDGPCATCGHTKGVHSPSIESGKGVGCTWWGCGCGDYKAKEESEKRKCGYAHIGTGYLCSLLQGHDGKHSTENIGFNEIIRWHTYVDIEKRVGVPCPHDQGWTMDGDRDICNRCGSRASL